MSNNVSHSNELKRHSTCALYLRVSSDEQVQGFGLSAQEDACRALATRSGYPDPQVFSDPGLSGTLPREQRPGLDRLLATVEQGAVQVVVVGAIDRLARSARVALSIRDVLRSADCSLLSAREYTDLKTANGCLMFGISALLAEHERETMRERLGSGLEKRKQTDGDIGGRVPFGYRRLPKSEGRGIVVAPDQAVIVQRIFSLSTAGLHASQIAALLDADHVPTARGGRQWRSSAISRILGNEAVYRGGQRNGDTHWPTILSGDNAV
jgi:site-specific DNA recombinase